MSFTVGFIGAGNMGGALAKAAVATVGGAQMILADQNKVKCEELAFSLGCETGETAQVAQASRFIFLGVKPHIMPSLLRDLQPVFQARPAPPVLVSMAAGLTLAQLADMAGDRYPMIRIMPNTPVAEGAGVVLYVCNEAVTQQQKDAFLSLMARAGRFYPLEEGLMDAGSAVSGCGPAFAYLFMDALADGGVACGLSREDALKFAAQTVLGAAQMILSTGKHPDQLKNEVCSPGGSTIQGVRCLEQHALRASCMDAVIAAFEKTRDLGKQ